MNLDLVASYLANGSDVVALVNALFTIGGALFALFFRLIIKRLSEHKLKSVLAFGKKKSIVTVPFYERKIYGYTDSLVLKRESLLQHRVISVLTKLNLKSEQQLEPNENNCNEIHIGGPIANIRTSAYIKNFFPALRWRIKPEHRAQYKEGDMQKVYNDLIKVDADKEGFVFGNNENEILEYSKNELDYAILVKLTKQDLGQEKTVHLLFGGGRSGTQISVDFFINNYAELYKRFGKHHYFIAIPVNTRSTNIDYRQGVIDLTSKLFC